MAVVLDEERAAESRAFSEARALQVINIARGGRGEENMRVYVRLLGSSPADTP